VRAGSAAVVVVAQIGPLQKTLTLGPRVIALAKKAPPSAEVCRALVGTSVALAKALRSVNEEARARAVLDDALAFSRSPAARPYRRQIATSIASLHETLSNVALSHGDRAQALGHAEEARAVLDAALGERIGDHRRKTLSRQMALSHVQVAKLQLEAGHTDAAADAIAKARALATYLGKAEITIDVAVQGAVVALARGDAAGALRELVAVRSEAERAGFTTKLIDIDRFTSQAHVKLGNPDAALAAVTSALTRIEATRADLQDATLRAGFLEHRQGLYESAVRLALRVDKVGDAFALAERARSRAFLDLLGSASLSKRRTAALAQEESALRARMAEAAALARDDDADETEGPSSRARDRVAAAERDYQAFLDRVRKENGEQASLMAVEPVTAAEIQALLPEGTVLVEYMLGGGDLTTWVMSRTVMDVRRQRMDRAALLGEVRQFRAAISSQADLVDVRSRAQALYQKVLEPVRGLIAGKRLLVVPHDVLHYLPFAALRSPQGRWVVEDHAVGTVPSASVLKFLVGKGAAASDRVLAVGNPELGPALALRYAEREVRAIGERYPSTSTVLTRAAASERNVKRESVRAGLLHFAVHGELSETDPMSSALLLGPGDGEDGRFEVRELFATELNASLVVLSACETGLGKLSRGDELVGLQRAFLYAGTPAVVTTLWKVDDRASFLLMRAFYDALAAKGPTEALRSAQRALIVDFPHPFAWAAFGVSGAPR